MMMDARAQQIAQGEEKQRNARNRRVLKDIGNLVIDGGDQGKKQKAIVGRGVTRAATKKEVEKPTEVEVIVISSDDDSEKPAARPVSRRQVVEPQRKKGVKTVTAILTARSKAACGLKNRPRDVVVDIDIADVDNHLAVVEYVDDLYNYYKLAEVDSIVHDYMEAQPDVTAKMRSILVDWLIEVHRKFELMPETLYLTLNLVDRFMAVKSVTRRELQLVGISSMLIACKYEEIWAPQVYDFVCISDKAYTGEQVLLMEKAILQRLEWYLTVPTPYVFLVRYVKASVPHDAMVENMSFFLAELGLVHYSVAIAYSPSLIAASAVFAARCTLHKTPFWDETLKHHTGYKEDQLLGCAKKLAELHSGAAESRLKAVVKKFSSADRGSVALLPAAKLLLIGSSDVVQLH
ncbi:CYCB1-4 [Linum grandiflorum]